MADARRTARRSHRRRDRDRVASAPADREWVPAPIERRPFDSDQARRMAGRAQFRLGDDPYEWGDE